MDILLGFLVGFVVCFSLGHIFSNTQRKRLESSREGERFLDSAQVSKVMRDKK